MKIILHIDSCIKSNVYNPIRINQYVESCNSIFKYIDFFKTNNIDILLIDNSISTIDEFPTEIQNLIPNSINKIFKKNNLNYGAINKTAGVFEHWKLGSEIFKNYHYIIHFELRQKLLNIDFIKEFLQSPNSMFSWAHKYSTNDLGLFKNKDSRFNISSYSRENVFIQKSTRNNFYSGHFICRMDEFIKFVDGANLDNLIRFNPKYEIHTLEVLLMRFAYYILPEFKVVEKLNIMRYGDYYSMVNNIEYI